MRKLNRGSDNAISSAELQRIYYLSFWEVRQIVRDLRLAGNPIGAGPHGYYICETAEEYDALAKLLTAEYARQALARIDEHNAGLRQYTLASIE
jgi:hypothetical protein